MTQLWPPLVDAATLTRQVWGVDSARRIPGVGRALDLIAGLISQMTLDDYAGVQPQRRPRLLDDPDLDMVRSVFVRCQVEDFLLHGNAAHLVTVTDSAGFPAATKYYPAYAWTIHEDRDGRRRWYLHGREVPAESVVHVQLGADPVTTARGVGIVERYVNSLDRLGLQEESERVNLRGGGVPSVAVIAPQKELTSAELTEAGQAWDSQFSGPGRRPALLPNGTQVIPLSWSPNDQQATLARQLSLTDTANMFNLDNYWLGAPGSSHTYRSPGPLFLMLLRTTLEPVLTVFEDAWSLRWLPPGHRVRFDRQAVLADDFQTTINSLVKAAGRPVMTVNEARTRHLSMAPLPEPDADQLAQTPGTFDPEEDSESEDTEQQEPAEGVTNG